MKPDKRVWEICKEGYDEFFVDGPNSDPVKVVPQSELQRVQKLLIEAEELLNKNLATFNDYGLGHSKYITETFLSKLQSECENVEEIRE